MSDFKFACPRCSQRLRCSDRHVGREILCPKCSHRIIIPNSEGRPFSRPGVAGAPGVDATMAPQMSIPPAQPSDSSTHKGSR